MEQFWFGRLTRARERVVEWPRFAKRAVLASSDFVLLLFAVWLAFSVRLGRIYGPDNWQLVAVLLSAPVLGCFFLWRLALYRIAARFIHGEDAVRMCLRSAFRFSHGRCSSSCSSAPVILIWWSLALSSSFTRCSLALSSPQADGRRFGC